MSPANARSKVRAINPVHATVEVAAPLAKAFEVFTKRMTDWWPVEYAMVPTPRQVIIEPRKDGRWYERGADGSEKLVATVTAWDPPGRVAFAWHIDGAWQSHPKLAAAGKGTRVTLEHGDLERFGEQAEATRNGLSGQGGWGDLLQGFAKAVAKR